MKSIYFSALALGLLSGCTTVQNVSKSDAGRITNVCIVEHKEVRETVLETIEEGLTKHGVKYRVIPGSYVIQNKLWVPSFQYSQTSGCDAVMFYVANWTWDITMYMHFANIWMVSPDSKMTKLGNANYDSRASLNKYINAHDKLIELIDGIFSDYKALPPSPVQPAQATPPTNVPVAAATAAAPIAAKTNASSTTSTTSQKLRELQSLKNDGVITEDEFQVKKKQLLEQM